MSHEIEQPTSAAEAWILLNNWARRVQGRGTFHRAWPYDTDTCWRLATDSWRPGARFDTETLTTLLLVSSMPNGEQS